MRLFSRWTIALSFLMVLMGLSLLARSLEARAAVSEPLAQVDLELLRETLRLTTLEAQFSTQADAEIAGYLGGIRSSVFVRAIATYAIDVEAMEVIRHDPAARLIVIRLPEPKLARIIIDPLAIEPADPRRYGAWIVSPFPTREDEALTHALRQAERRVRSQAEQSEYITRARQSAESTLTRWLTTQGYTLQIHWQQ